MSDKLGRYHITFNHSMGEDFSEYQFDEKGIPLVYDKHIKSWYYNPITNSQYALHLFNSYYEDTKDETIIKKILTLCNWLTDHCSKGPNNSSIWKYDFDLDFYGIKKPWISGMAQGEAISTLLRAYQLTNKRRYVETAESAWHIFSVRVKDGGIIGEFDDGSIVIEEYPFIPHVCVLNGFIFAIFGVYDYWISRNSIDAKALFNNCIKSIKNNLKNYDPGYWSYYDLWTPRRLCSKAYHRLHVIQLRQLYYLTGDSFFNEFAKRWDQYTYSHYSRIRWYMEKILFRLRYGEL